MENDTFSTLKVFLFRDNEIVDVTSKPAYTKL